jgi:crotonobetainyl-CoA:carnitine CoA-transferase CaiB-like acyl-CoA transferase
MYFAAHNRNKQSIVVNLKHAASSTVVERLIAWADVIVTNYTPGAIERLGLDFNAAARINPRVVVVRISAYGLTGSNRDVPGFDGTVQARSGLAHMVGEANGPPTITSVPLTDYFAAVEGALGAVLALRRRDLTGKGEEVDVSMMDATSTVLGYLYAEVLDFGVRPKRTGSRAPYALTGAFEARDGFVYIAPMGDHAWSSLCGLIGRPEWSSPGAEYADADARLRDRDIIERAVTEWTRALPRDDIVDRLMQAGIPCGQVNSVEEISRDSMLRERDMLRPVELGVGGPSVPMPGIEIKLRDTRSSQRAIVPRLGADTQRVLARLGFSEPEVEQLKWCGAIA